MKKFARCVLILIFVIIVSGACGYFYEDKTLTTMYTSTTPVSYTHLDVYKRQVDR